MKPLDFLFGALAIFSFIKKQKKKAAKKDKKEFEDAVLAPSGPGTTPQPAPRPETEEEKQRESKAVEQSRQTWVDARAAGGLRPDSAGLALHAYHQAGGNQSSMIVLWQKAIDPTGTHLPPTGVYDSATMAHLAKIERYIEAGKEMKGRAPAHNKADPIAHEVESTRGIAQEDANPEDGAVRVESGDDVDVAAALDYYVGEGGDNAAFIALQQQRLGVPQTGVYDAPTANAVRAVLAEESPSEDEEDLMDEAIDLAVTAQGSGYGEEAAAAAALDYYAGEGGSNAGFIAIQQKTIGVSETGDYDAPTSNKVREILAKATPAPQETASPEGEASLAPNEATDPSAEEPPVKKPTIIRSTVPIAMSPTVIEFTDEGNAGSTPMPAPPAAVLGQIQKRNLSASEQVQHERASDQAAIAYAIALNSYPSAPQEAAALYLQEYVRNGGVAPHAIAIAEWNMGLTPTGTFEGQTVPTMEALIKQSTMPIKPKGE